MMRNREPRAIRVAFLRASSTFVVCLLAVMPAHADRLELRNGDVISGTIERMDSQTVVVRTEYGLLELSRAAIVRGEFGLDTGEVIDSLVFRFDFDGSMDDTTGLTRATNNGLRFVADRHGTPASAVRSEGNGTFLSVAPTAELNGLNQFSLTFWIRLEDLGSTQYLFSKWNRAEGETADGKFTLQTSGGSLTAYFVDDGGVYHWLTARSVLEQMAWHAVAVTFVGGRANIYVDGVLVASDRFDFVDLMMDNSPVLVMTAQSQTEDEYAYYNAPGSIDDLRLYARALSPEEVLTLASESGSE